MPTFALTSSHQKWFGYVKTMLPLLGLYKCCSDSQAKPWTADGEEWDICSASESSRHQRSLEDRKPIASIFSCFFISWQQTVLDQQLWSSNSSRSVVKVLGTYYGALGTYHWSLGTFHWALGTYLYCGALGTYYGPSRPFSIKTPATSSISCPLTCGVPHCPVLRQSFLFILYTTEFTNQSILSWPSPILWWHPIINLLLFKQLLWIHTSYSECGYRNPLLDDLKSPMPEPLKNWIHTMEPPWSP